MISVQCLDSLETVFCARQVCCFYDNRPLRMSSKQEVVKNKTTIVKKKTFRKKFINKSEYIRNKQDNFQIPYWHIEIYVDSYCK